MHMPAKKTLRYTRFFVLLLILVSFVSAESAGKRKKDQRNDHFRDIAKKIQEAHYNKDMDKVLDMFYNNCIKDGKMKPRPEPGKETKQFKRVSKEIRAHIYQCVAFSYFALDRPAVGNIYLRKLLNESKSQFNEAFRIISEEMKGLSEDGKLYNVIERFKRYCLKARKGNTYKEKMVFKKVSGDIRADIYHLAALAYDDLEEINKRDIYIKKLLDTRLSLESDIYRPSWREMAKKKYIVLPRLLLGIKIGINSTIPHIGQRYSILGPAFSTEGDPYCKEYSYKLAHILGGQLGGILEYTLKKRLSICLEVNSLALNFRYNNILNWEVIDGNQGAGDVKSLIFIHRHNIYYLEFPILLKYRFVKNQSKLVPYLQMGGYLRFLQLFANKSIMSDLGIEETFNFKKLFNRFNSGFCVGAGIGYDTVLKGIQGIRFRLEFEVNYKHGFNNVVNEDRRYTHEELVFGYYDVFDDMKLSNWHFGFKLLLRISDKPYRK